MSLPVVSKKIRSNFCVLVSAVIAFSSAPEVARAFGPSGVPKEFGSDVVRMLEQEGTLAPFASVVFCMKAPEQCRKVGGQSIMDLDAERGAQLSRVNSTVNRSIRPVNDRSGTDDWEVDVKSGDCEDFALTKRKQLIELGWSSSSLRIAVALTSSGEGHAVLIAKTSAGDLVLDNRTSAIMDWRKTDLRFLKVQSRDNPKQWQNVGQKAKLVASAPKKVRTVTATLRRMDPVLRQASDIGNY